MIRRLLLLLLLLSGASPAWAVSITGVMVYSADDFGTPSGFDTFDRPEAPQMHMWRTYAAGIWHSLAIYEGLPPQSITGRARPLNAGNFSIDIPLIEGENFFTIVGEPGPITATDTYDGFVVSLYFDGGLNTPGISALFPRYGSEEGEATRTNRSTYIYSFDVTLAQQRSPGVDDTGLDVYDDGIEKVTVTGASFLPEDRFVSVDLIGGQKFGQSGTADFVGSLVILVEPSEGGPGVDSPGTGRRVGGAPVGGGQPRGAIAGGPAVGSRPFAPGGVPGGAGMNAGGFANEEFGAAQGAARDDGFEWVAGDEAADSEPADEEIADSESADGEVDDDDEPKDIVGALRQWIDTGGEETPTPEADEADAADAGAAVQAEGTPTPAATGATTTPTAEVPSATGTPSPDATPATPLPTRTPSPDATATRNAAAAATTTVSPPPVGTPTPARDDQARADGEKQAAAATTSDLLPSDLLPQV